MPGVQYMLLGRKLVSEKDLVTLRLIITRVVLFLCLMIIGLLAFAYCDYY